MRLEEMVSWGVTAAKMAAILIVTATATAITRCFFVATSFLRVTFTVEVVFLFATTSAQNACRS